VSTADSVDVSVFGGTVAASSRVALPADEGRRAVGTPDYLAPELLLGENTFSGWRLNALKNGNIRVAFGSCAFLKEQIIDAWKGFSSSSVFEPIFLAFLALLHCPLRC